MTSPAPRRRLSRTAIVLLSVGAVLVLLGAAAAAFGPAFYRDVIVGAQPPAPTAAPEQGASASPVSPVTDLDGAWQVADGSFAGYRVDEVLNGTDVTVVGRTEEVTGEAHVQDLTLRSAEVTVDVASIATDAPRRDAYFRDTALQVSEYPTASFRLTEPVSVESEPRAGDEATVDVEGELTLHGVTREVTAQLDASFDGGTARVAGSIPITFADFEVDAPNLGFVSVEPEGFVEFLLVLEKAP